MSVFDDDVIVTSLLFIPLLSNHLLRFLIFLFLFAVSFFFFMQMRWSSRLSHNPSPSLWCRFPCLMLMMTVKGIYCERDACFFKICFGGEKTRDCFDLMSLRQPSHLNNRIQLSSLYIHSFEKRKEREEEEVRSKRPFTHTIFSSCHWLSLWNGIQVENRERLWGDISLPLLIKLFRVDLFFTRRSF